MKKNALAVLTLLLGFCLFIFACRKDINFLVNGKESASSEVLESAKIWRLQKLTRKVGLLKPLWDDSWRITSSQKKELLIVPAPEHFIKDENNRIRRFFVFSISKNEISNGEIVEFLGSNYKVEANLDTLLKNYDEKEIKGFSGAIIKYDINYSKISETEFAIKSRKSRSKTQPVTLTPKFLQTLKNPSTSLSFASNVSCAPAVSIFHNYPESFCPNAVIQSYYVATIDPDGCYTFVDFYYQGHTCPSGSGSGSGNGSGSGSGSGSASNGEDNPPYGGGTWVKLTSNIEFTEEEINEELVPDITTITPLRKNPAKVNFNARLVADAYLGGATPLAVIESVHDLSMSIVNGNTTKIYLNTIHPNGTEDTWHSVLGSGVSITHGPTGFPTIWINWQGTKYSRYTLTYPGQNPQSITYAPYYYNKTKTYSAYGNLQP